MSKNQEKNEVKPYGYPNIQGIKNRDITYDHLAESACGQIQRLAGT